jgi:hypothetical protein
MELINVKARLSPSMSQRHGVTAAAMTAPLQ